MEVSNSIIIHHLLQLTGSIGSIACVVTALNVPWAHPKVPISRGLYEIDVPVDIGLLRCFSSICKQYESIEKFLVDSDGTGGHGNSSSSVQYAASSPWHLPVPQKLNHIKSPLILERDAIRTFLRPYRTASFVTITFLSLSTLLAVYLTVLILYRLCCFQCGAAAHKHVASTAVIPFHNLLLVLTLFTMFLATMSYLTLTCSHLNGGRYVDGVWITAYCCICGLLCCLISAILKEPRHRGDYMTISDCEEEEAEESVRSHHRHGRHYQTDCTQTTSQLDSGDLELCKATAPPLIR